MHASPPHGPFGPKTNRPVSPRPRPVQPFAAPLQPFSLKISGEDYEVTVEGEPESDKGTVAVDNTTTPKRMTIKGVQGPNKGKTFLAIWEMKDDRSMRVCYDLAGKEFPKEFKAPKGTSFYLVGYRRMPNKEKE